MTYSAGALLGLGVVALATTACNDPVACAERPLDTPGWTWTEHDVWSLPLVADVDGDGGTDVLVNINAVDAHPFEDNRGELVLLDGTTGAEKWRLVHDPARGSFGSDTRATAAIADVSGDGVPDIVFAGRPEGEQDLSPIHAVDGRGKLLWTSRLPDGTVARLKVVAGAAAVANLDDDPGAEIVFGAAILDHDGLLVWNNPGSTAGTPLGSTGQELLPGSLATITDLDGDGAPEIVTGREAWRIVWLAGDPPQVTLSLLWQNTDGMGNDGWPAVADLDDNGTPEVVLTAWPEIRVIDGRTGRLWCGVDPTGSACAADDSRRTPPIPIQGGNLGGPATLADFDGDGRLEAAIAGGMAYAVYDFHRPGEAIVRPELDPPPAPGAMYVRWSIRTQDHSSASTGASAFDLDGDGRPEILYQDECAFRVIDGADGTVRTTVQNSSATLHEYPVVVDLDGDAAPEVLVIANLSKPQAVADCQAADPTFVARQGVYVYTPGGAPGSPGARNVWTQHTHHGSDVDDAGNVPLQELPAWLPGGSNSFRQGLARAPLDECR